MYEMCIEDDKQRESSKLDVQWEPIYDILDEEMM